MMQMINQILSGCPGQIPGGMSTDICQIAIDSCAGGLIKGSVQNAPLNYIRRFYGTVDLAATMGNLFDTGLRKLSGPGECREEINVITKETWNAYRRGGKKGTFLIKVLFREHSTWQGIIYWRDTGEKQMFRSFMEMMLLMASTTEVDQIEQREPKSDMIRKSV